MCIAIINYYDCGCGCKRPPAREEKRFKYCDKAYSFDEDTGKMVFIGRCTEEECETKEVSVDEMCPVCITRRIQERGFDPEWE